MDHQCLNHCASRIGLRWETGDIVPPVPLKALNLRSVAERYLEATKNRSANHSLFLTAARGS